jgi:hypothetical protein
VNGPLLSYLTAEPVMVMGSLPHIRRFRSCGVARSGRIYDCAALTPRRSYWPAMQNKWCSPRISSRFDTATGEAMTRSSI